MPTFVKLDPKDALVGRSRAAAAAREPYVQALMAGDAGRIELERGETQGVVKRRLQEAARGSGITIRSS